MKRLLLDYGEVVVLFGDNSDNFLNSWAKFFEFFHVLVFDAERFVSQLEREVMVSRGKSEGAKGFTMVEEL